MRKGKTERQRFTYKEKTRESEQLLGVSGERGEEKNSGILRTAQERWEKPRDG